MTSDVRNDSIRGFSGAKRKKNRKPPHMDERLVRLIGDYHQAVRKALALMQKSGIPLPKSSGEWLDTDLSHISCLNGGVGFWQHGIGFKVDFPEGSVDFDFGKFGEISGFDAWRLSRFAAERLPAYGFNTEQEFAACFNKAVKNKELTPLASSLYYRTNTPLEFATSIDNRADGDLLPHRDLDLVLTLHMHYFYSADLMLSHYEPLKKKLNDGKSLSRDEEINFRIYLNSWLGFLSVTCEGYQDANLLQLLTEGRPSSFQKLVPQFKELNSSISEHYDELRKLRNSIFHLRDDVNDTIAFFTPGKDLLLWARSVHTGLKSFFSAYRVQCECHYHMNKRKSDADLGPEEL